MRLLLNTLLVSAAARAVWSQTNSPSPPTIDLGYARYQGQVNPTTGSTEFLGIRFAAPPTGNLRWRRPQLPGQQIGLQLAISQPNRCYEAEGLGTNTNPERPMATSNITASGFLESRQIVPRVTLPPMSEDCLFLNVYSPPKLSSQSSRKLPVIVWIHGGGYMLGSASGSAAYGGLGAYDGNDLVRQSGGKAIVVVIQYRIGLFGFLSSRHIKRDGALNAGLLDQEFALQWVQKHIHKFGGDAAKVTIWGESAGAGSAMLHLIANGGDTRPALFRASIMGSPAIPPQYPFDHTIPERLFSEVVNMTGCPPSPSSSQISCLRLASAGALQSANIRLSREAFYFTITFAPVVDGTYIRESPTRALLKGKVNTKNVLVVDNAREGDLFINPLETHSVSEFTAITFPSVNQQTANAAAALYAGRGSAINQMSELMATFICPSIRILQAVNGNGYKGAFAIPPALHGDDLSYYFSSLNPNGPAYGNQQFNDAFVRSFLDFALEQNPNIKHATTILPNWPKWKPSSPMEMIFNRTGDLPDIATRATSTGLKERCKFWDSVASSTFQ